MTEGYQEINCLGLKCPLPALRLEKALRAGQRCIVVLADDPVSVVDIPLCAHQWGAQISVENNPDGSYKFVIVREAV